jgi:hypothetical protein
MYMFVINRDGPSSRISRLDGLSRLKYNLMSDVTGLDKKGTLGAIVQFAVVSEMYSGVGHIIKYMLLNLTQTSTVFGMVSHTRS